MLREASDDPMVWKRVYKKQVLAAHGHFAKEAMQNWRIAGQPDARLRVYWNGEGAWRAQGILYCNARALLALWQDVDFERRADWGDLYFAAPQCETVVETFFTQNLGEIKVARCKDGQYRLFWTHEDAESTSWTVMSIRCDYRLEGPVSRPPQWTAICIAKLDDDSQFGSRCYVRAVAWNEPCSIYESLVTQMAVCEAFCRSAEKWDALYSTEAMTARDLSLRH